MKRNWNVVRKILELVEEGKLKDYIEEKRYRDEFSINSPDDGAPNELLGHFEILVDAGILKGNFHKFEKAAFSSPPIVSATTLPASAPIRC